MTGLSRGRLWAVMAGVGLGMLLAALDQTVVSTAMPKVVAHLGGFSLYSWVFTAYMLTSTTTVPIYGKLSDLYGRKIFFLWGMIVFMVASVLSGRSGSMTQLIVFRGLQGIGAGALMPVALAIIGDLFPPGERGKVQGLMGTVFGISSVVGPSLGGYITDNLNWRWVFYVNIPIGILAVIVVVLTMPRERRERANRPIDYLGAATLVAALVPLLLALSEVGDAHPWLSAYILGLLAGAAVMLVVFLVVEARAQEPLLPLDLFRNRIFTVSVAAVFLSAAGMFGAIMFIPLFVQGVVGTSATNSGYILTPMMFSLIASSVIGGQLISRWGRYRILALGGLATMTLGMFLLSRMGTTTTSAVTVRNMIITGLGLGVTMPLYVIAVQNAFPHARMGVVTSSVAFFRSIGGTVGVAVMGSVMADSFSRRLAEGLPAPLKAAMPPQALAALSNPQALLSPEAKAAIGAQLPPGQAGLAAQLFDALRSALAGSITEVFLIGAIVAGAAWVVNLFLREIPLRKTHEAPAEAPAGLPAEAPAASTSEAPATRPGRTAARAAEESTT
ncbi:MAG: DHA2 family efflux MFS transporter permease subunit [Actinobacteria bacterium]|nr:DHA2 family efflux MFS transporter permease subunit [Actinomycetota bacterium]